MLKSAVGLEAEFFLVNADGDLVLPSDYGFPVDDFCLLGEIRAEAGEDRPSAIANFYKAYYQTVEQAKRHNLTLDIEAGYNQIPPAFRNKCIRAAGHKPVSAAKNIYPNIDIMSLSDAVVENGAILYYHVSCGLHIHFSAQEVQEVRETVDLTTYSSVQIPLAFEKISANLDLYRRDKEEKREIKVKAQANLITKPVVHHIVRLFDEQLLPSFAMPVPLKYRNAGFYEVKPYGFEYRSLPFNKASFERVPEIVSFAFAALEDLSP